MGKNKKKSNGNAKPAEETVQIEVVETNIEPDLDQDKDIVTEPPTPTSNGNSEIEHNEKVKVLEGKIAELQLKLDEIETQKHLDKENEDMATGSSELEQLKIQLKKSEETSEQHKSSYESLLSRLSSMKSIFSKMKEAQTELEEYKEKLNESNSDNDTLVKKIDTLTSENAALQESLATLKEETIDLNNECDRLSHDLSKFRREYQTHSDTFSQEKDVLDATIYKLTNTNTELKSKIQQYLIFLDENKVNIQRLNDEIEDLNHNLLSKDQEISDLKNENIDLISNTENLKSLIRSQEVSFEKEKLELKNEIIRLKEEMNLQLLQESQNSSKVEQLQAEISKLSRFEQESKEKQLQIGKLRHEAIILNEHLTKALKLMKKDVNSDTVDKELVSNLFISFLSLPRGDNKKFQALQLISSFLGWDENKKIAAGLSHKPNTKRGGAEGGEIRDSFVSLWTDYLEKESTK